MSRILQRDQHAHLARINNFAYIRMVTSAKMKRWRTKLGAEFTPGKGSHLKIRLNGKTSVLPMHGKEMKKGKGNGTRHQETVVPQVNQGEP